MPEMEKVIFRKFKEGDIIAMFPRIPADRLGYHIESYQHIGQHGLADPGIVSITKLAMPEEYQSLKEELESIGYNLKIVKKITYRDFLYRKNLLQKWRNKE
jgi:hypothetical protein